MHHYETKDLSNIENYNKHNMIYQIEKEGMKTMENVAHMLEYEIIIVRIEKLKCQ